MNGHRFRILVYCIICVILSGCQHPPVGSPTKVQHEPPREEPVVPAGYTKISPAPLDSSTQMLAQTATIFRGKLKEIHFTYDFCGGPRTQYVFDDSSPLVGAIIASHVTRK